MAKEDEDYIEKQGSPIGELRFGRLAITAPISVSNRNGQSHISLPGC